MSAAAMANCAAGNSGVGPGVKRRTFFNMQLFYGVSFRFRVAAIELSLIEFIRNSFAAHQKN
jgi:hypothetical protein